MIKINFGGFSFNPIDYLVTSFHNGRPKPTANIETPINDTWNGTTRLIQTIFTPAYTITMNMRETEYQNFQLIQYASIVNIWYDEFYYTSRSDLITLESTTTAKDFREVVLTFGNLKEQKTENTINNSPLIDKLIFIGTPFEFNIHVNIVSESELLISKISDFKNIINDYKKLTDVKKIRLYLSEDFYKLFNSFAFNVKEINNIAMKINSESELYFQFEIESTLIGNKLYRINLTLFKTDPIISKEY